VQVTEAMVNIRATIDRAGQLGVIDPGVAGALVRNREIPFLQG